MTLSKFATDRLFAGGYANTVLYRMCEEAPTHKDIGIVRAKLRLIGRFYSASPDRGTGKGRDPDADFFKLLARRLEKSELDKKLAAARQWGRVSALNLHQIDGILAYFNNEVVDFIKSNRGRSGPKNRMVHNRISFSSKYLHFHAPMAFFIYDSVVREKLRVLKFPAGPSYSRYCEGLLKYADKHCPRSAWTPRSIDQAIYGYETV